MKRFPGNLLFRNSTTPGGPGQFGAAPGMWSLDSALQFIKSGKWPTQGLNPAGQIAYYSAGTYTWVCPPGITSVSVVCVGGGGPNGGGGGELRYKNNISVTPGNSYTVVVGAQGTFTYGFPFSNGGTSTFNSTTCVANGGKAGGNGAQGGSGGTGDGGGNGGPGGSAVTYPGTLGFYGYYNGGGGAGGYAGDGGSGGANTNPDNAQAGGNGTGGAGGGGNSGFSTWTSQGGNWGGGVGLLGQGTNGAGAPLIVFPTTGQFNAPGGNGSPTGNEVSNPSTAGRGSGYQGSDGAVRIIWGGNQVTRSFPSTNTGDYNV